MQLLDVQLGSFTHSTPDDLTTLLMNFEHVFLGVLECETKHFLKHHRDVTHQVHRIVMHDHVPGKIERLFGSRFLCNVGRRNGVHDFRKNLHENEQKPALKRNSVTGIGRGNRPLRA